MSQEQQPEALRLADALRDGNYSLYQERAATEAELRHLHARVVELEAQVQRAQLTDEQWTKIWAEWFDSDQDAEDLIRAIERAHGIGKEQP